MDSGITDQMTVGEALQRGSRRLRSLGLQDADVETALLLKQATGLERLVILTEVARVLSRDAAERFCQLLDRRARREPLAYIRGSAEFMSLEFKVGPAVLIPRPQTEHLVEAVLDLEAEAEPNVGRLAVDFGTGSGAIAVSLAYNVHSLRVVATDPSPLALEVARDNAQRHGVSRRVTLVEGAGLAPLAQWAGAADYLVANPPYIPTRDIAGLEAEVRDWEPMLALDGGPDGLSVHRDLAAGGLSLLKPGGYLVLEVMSGQAPAVMDLLGEWTDVRSIKDYLGWERVVVARKP